MAQSQTPGKSPAAARWRDTSGEAHADVHRLAQRKAAGPNPAPLSMAISQLPKRFLS